MIQTHFDDFSDTHLCIICNRRIVGLDNYVEHRKQSCQNRAENALKIGLISSKEKDDDEDGDGEEAPPKSGPPGLIISTPRANALDHSSYGPFEFNETDHETSVAQHGGKASKSLGGYLPYELGADAFFSSLRLQSVQTGGVGKSASSTHAGRYKSVQHGDPAVSWIERDHAAETAANTTTASTTDNLMKAVHNLSGAKKPYEDMFQAISFDHESPDISEAEGDEGDEEDDDDDEEEEERLIEIQEADVDDEDDDDFDDDYGEHLPQTSGGKWKFPQQRHSPPVVPATHTGGKWRPEQRPSLHVTHSQLRRESPTWGDEPNDEATGQHPPDGHTKGKWVPGSKFLRLDYKEELLPKPQQDYWCHICCRKLKTRAIYEQHLKTSYHLKRDEPEIQLERVDLNQRSILSAVLSADELRDSLQQLAERRHPMAGEKRKRYRRRTFLKCELCKMVIGRHVIGKHLISHYHYRRMQMHRSRLKYALGMVLQHIHQVVLQSPFQCRPCRYYFNTEQAFMEHWTQPAHLKACTSSGNLWCSYCSYECETNEEMLEHLKGSEHQEVVMAINRSVPICISKKVNIVCPQCGLNFRYNVQLREHLQMYHPDCGDDSGAAGTASAAYQGQYKCRVCQEKLRSKIALQRHEKNAHFITKYFCSICCVEFATPCQARRHRKTLAHRQAAESKSDGGAAKVPTTTTRSRKEPSKSSLECELCNFKASSDFEAMLHSIDHEENLIKPTQAAPSSKLPASPKKSSVKKRKLLTTFKCKDCSEVFENREALIDHRDTKHPLLLHLCMQCAMRFPSAQALGRHSRVCQPQGVETAASQPIATFSTKWSCDQCNFIAPYESELIYHRFFHTHGKLTKRSKLSCPFCGKTASRDSLRCHLRLHTNEKNFECEICNLKFARRHHLKDHIKKVHRRPTATIDTPDIRRTETAAPVTATGTATAIPCNFPCLTCGKVFATQISLADHCVAHDEHGERNFTCNHEGCHYVGLSSERLQKHMATHTEKTHKCPVDDCSYVGTEVNLKKHTKSKHSTATATYKCDHCSFTDRSKSHLERHLRSHSGEKPFACPYCDTRCTSFDNIRKHILKTNKHPGRFIYECKLCESREGSGEVVAFVFKSNSNVEYQKHLKKEHKDA